MLAKRQAEAGRGGKKFGMIQEPPPRETITHICRNLESYIVAFGRLLVSVGVFVWGVQGIFTVYFLQRLSLF